MHLCDIFYVHRYYSSDQLLIRANRFRNLKRRQDSRAYPADVETFPDRFITLHSNALVPAPELLAEIRRVTIQDAYTSHGYEGLCNSYNTINEAKVLNCQSTNVIAQFTGGVPTVDFLTSDVMQNNGGYDFPNLKDLDILRSKRCVSEDTLKAGHKFMEVTLNSDMDVKAVKKFFKDNYLSNNKECLTNVVGFAVQCIYVPLGAHNKVFSDDLGVQPSTVTFESSREFTEARGYPIVAKFLLGGSNWTLALRFDIDCVVKPDGMYEYTLNRSALPSKMENWIYELPLLCGFQEVKRSASLLEDMLTLVGCEASLKWVSVDAIAVAAGFHSAELSRFNLAFQILGGLLNEIDTVGEYTWSKPYEQLEESLKIYAIGLTRVAFNCWLVLQATLIRNIFPDPEVMCLLMNKPQHKVISWFCGFISCILAECTVDDKKYCDAKTRRTLVSCINIEDEKRMAQLSEFIKLVPPTPTITFGSARYLHSARFFALEQAKILAGPVMADLECNSIWTKIEITPFLKKMITYDQELCEPFPGDASSKVWMAANPLTKMKFTPAGFDSNKVTNGEISKFAASQGRDSRIVVLEWIRLNPPSLIENLLRRSSEALPISDRLWFSSVSRYEDLKQSYLFTTGTNCSVSNDWADKKIEKSVNTALNKADEEINILTKRASEVLKRKREIMAVVKTPGKRLRLDTGTTLQTNSTLTAAQLERKKRKNKKCRQKYKERRRTANKNDDGNVPYPNSKLESTDTVKDSLKVTVDYLLEEPAAPNGDPYSKIVTDFVNANPNF